MTADPIAPPIEQPGAFLPRSGDPGFNPRTDAPAVWRMGAVFVSDNRYFDKRTGWYMTRDGCLLRPDDCPGCNGNGFVKVRTSGLHQLPVYRIEMCRQCGDSRPV